MPAGSPCGTVGSIMQGACRQGLRVAPLHHQLGGVLCFTECPGCMSSGAWASRAATFGLQQLPGANPTVLGVLPGGCAVFWPLNLPGWQWLFFCTLALWPWCNAIVQQQWSTHELTSCDQCCCLVAPPQMGSTVGQYTCSRGLREEMVLWHLKQLSDLE